MTDQQRTASPSREHFKVAREIADAMYDFEAGSGMEFQLRTCTFNPKLKDLVIVNTETGAHVEILHPMGQDVDG
jgi:hypothetical protein